MSTFAQGTKVQQMEVDKPHLTIQLQVEAKDGIVTRTESEILERVEDIIGEIKATILINSDELPVEVIQLGHTNEPGEVLKGLNLFAKGPALDDFLKKHPRAHELFFQLLGCRYPYIEVPNTEKLRCHNGGEGRTIFPSLHRGESQAAPPLDEAFKDRYPTMTDNVPFTKENGDVKDTVTLEKEAPLATSSRRPLHGDIIGNVATEWPISLQELEIAERLCQNRKIPQSAQSEESNSKVVQGEPNGTALREAAHECASNISDILRRFEKDSQKKIFRQMSTKSGAGIEKTAGPSGSGELTDDDGDLCENGNAKGEREDNVCQWHGIPSAPRDLQVRPYQGYYIEGPEIQLARALKFLADVDIRRTGYWECNLAELTDYFAHLLSIYQGEDWIYDLKDATRMLRARCIFESYHYGNPQLIVDFPTDLLPKRSTRLPQLDGPSIVFSAGSGSGQALTLPESPAEKQPDARIIYNNKMLENPPEKESRDPWAYTRAYRWFKEKELFWAQSTRGFTTREADSHRQWLQSDRPVMTLPRNWKGPVLPDLMDHDMKKTYELLRRCEKILQGLKRAEKRAPRGFIKAVLQAVDDGLEEKPGSLKPGLTFYEHELESTDGVNFTLANLRPTEAAWLEYICQPSRNRPHELEESLGKRGEIMVSRVTQMMQDINPFSLFGDTELKSLVKFLRELNSTCGGDVKRYEFTEKDVERLAPKLRDLNILRLHHNKVTEEWMFGRPEAEFHPEDLVTWPDHEPQMRQLPEEIPPARHTSQVELQGRNEDQTQDDASVTSDDTASTPVTVSSSAEDFHTYPKDMPRREDVLTLQEYVKNPVENLDWREKTAKFFCRLGYRLGWTIKVLQSEHEQNEKKLTDPETQKYNSDFLNTIIANWEDNTQKRPNNMAADQVETTTWRTTMAYPDVVKIADPDAYNEHREAWTKDLWPTSTEACELVRKNLLREAHENKTMLWPLHLPYNSYVTRYEVVNQTIWRNRRWNMMANIEDGRLDPETKKTIAETLKAKLQREEEEEEKKQDALAAQKQNLDTMRREPVWTFGHPSRKKLVPLFWDINNWPVHLQSESRQRIIRSRGPARKPLDDEGAADVADMAAFAEELEAEVEIPFWKRAEQRYKFVPGGEEFWMGDTQLQREEFKARMMRRLAPPSKKRSWGGALKEVLFGSLAKTDEPVTTSEGELELSAVPQDLIPESRPAKRRRITTPERNMGEDQEQERDLDAAAREVKKHVQKSNVLTVYSHDTTLKEGQVTFYAPEALVRDGESVVMEVGEPMVVYAMPG